MLLGEALIKAGIVTESQVQEALKAQSSNQHLSLGEVIHRLCAIPREIIESHYMALAIIPFIKEWLQKKLHKKSFADGLTLASTIADITLTIPRFSRYEGEVASFELLEDGMYKENSIQTKVERIRATVDPLIFTTVRKQEIVFNDVHLEIRLDEKGVRPENPGFLSELKLRILKATKEKG